MFQYVHSSLDHGLNNNDQPTWLFANSWAFVLLLQNFCTSVQAVCILEFCQPCKYLCDWLRQSLNSVIDPQVLCYSAIPPKLWYFVIVMYFVKKMSYSTGQKCWWLFFIWDCFALWKSEQYHQYTPRTTSLTWVQRSPSSQISTYICLHPLTMWFEDTVSNVEVSPIEVGR